MSFQALVLVLLMALLLVLPILHFVYRPKRTFSPRIGWIILIGVPLGILYFLLTLADWDVPE